MKRNNGVCRSIVLKKLIEMHINRQTEKIGFHSGIERRHHKDDAYKQIVVYKILLFDDLKKKKKDASKITHFAHKLNCKKGRHMAV